HALLLRRHDAKGGLATQKRSAQINGKHSIPGSYIHFNKWPYRHYSRAIHEHIDPSKSLHCLLKETLHILFARDITNHCQCIIRIAAVTCNLCHSLFKMMG